jgi:hypothetical protein
VNLRDFGSASLAAFLTLTVGSLPLVVLPTYFMGDIPRVTSTYMRVIPDFLIAALCFSALYLFIPQQRRTIRRGLLFGLLVGALISTLLGFHHSLPSEISELNTASTFTLGLVAVYIWHVAIWGLVGAVVAWATR